MNSSTYRLESEHRSLQIISGLLDLHLSIKITMKNCWGTWYWHLDWLGNIMLANPRRNFNNNLGTVSLALPWWEKPSKVNPSWGIQGDVTYWGQKNVVGASLKPQDRTIWPSYVEARVQAPAFKCTSRDNDRYSTSNLARYLVFTRCISHQSFIIEHGIAAESERVRETGEKAAGSHPRSSNEPGWE